VGCGLWVIGQGILGFEKNSDICSRKNQPMDKRIHTLIFLYVLYFIVAVTMCLFAPVQKFLTAFLFGATGIAIFLMFFGLWLAKSNEE